MIAVGGIGGTISGLVGTGIDIFTFSVMVLLFRLCATVSTPTSVVLMAFNSVVGFAIHCLILEDFAPVLHNYWLAAVPVVVVGAPLGAILSSFLERKTVIWIVIFLIFLDLISSLIMTPINLTLALHCLAVLVFFLCIYSWMLKQQAYQ